MLNFHSTLNKTTLCGA